MIASAAVIQFLRFGLVGVGNTLVDFAILNLLVALFDSPAGFVLLGCNAVAFLGASVNSYLCNRRWTFARLHHASMEEFGCFLLIALVGLLINSSLLWLLTSGAPLSLLHLNLSKGGATIASLGWNFIGYRLLFMRRRN